MGVYKCQLSMMEASAQQYMTEFSGGPDREVLMSASDSEGILDFNSRMGLPFSQEALVYKDIT